MNVCTVLDEIERLASGMANLPHCERAERVRDYVTIRVLIQDLEELEPKGSNNRHPNGPLQKLKQSCRSLAGLGEEISSPEKQAYSEAREALKALRTQFGLVK
jgi:hypothetical protein